jgi:glucose/arabinose dehydrogenase/mono/diheme cytochrome c family protein
MSRKASRIASPDASLFCRLLDDMNDPPLVPAPGSAKVAAMTTPIPPRLLACLLLITAAARAALPVPDADDGGISLPPGFRALVVADNLVIDPKTGKNTDRLRFLAVAPNGDVYAKLLHGGILALRDTDGDGRADVIKQFGPGDGGTHIMFHDGYLYHSSRTAVYRYKYVPGELVPSSPLEVIVHHLPAEKDHDAKAFAFDESGHMIVEVGSPYNVYSNPDRRLGAKGYSDEEVAKFQQTYGGFWSFDPAKPNQTQADGVRFSTGHRHCLALTWQPASKNFFMTMMGRDNLNIVDPEHYDALDNAERDAEEFHLLKPGVNLGWPYSYWDPVKQVRMRAPEYGGDNHRRDDNPAFDRPLLAFPAHWAPLQMCLYDGAQFPASYRGGMFLAFHGSWNRAPRAQAGYKVVFIPFGPDGLPTGDTAHAAGNYQDFATGFPGVDYFVNTRDARYRPAGVAVGPDGSLYISETERGRIWRVIYTGETAPAASRATPTSVAPAVKPLAGLDTPGGRIYAQICAACHMPDGRGVPGMQPSLAGSAVVAGDPGRLIDVVLRGPAAVLPADREKFNNVMPAYGAAFGDADLASLVNFLRKNFAPGSPDVTPAQIAARRAQP